MTNSDRIQLPVQAEFEKFIRLYDNSLVSSNPLLTDVVDYLRQKRGKMMRPVLVLLTAKLYGDIKPAAFHAAISLELLHTASLLHDDVVDVSYERRGQPSVNAVFGNKVAILSGDYLLSVCLIEGKKANNDDILSVVSHLAKELADGELLQLSNINNQFFSEEIYFDIIRKKTAALFGSCTKLGALSAEIDPERVELARLFGEYIGICFQIKDDIFDYFANQEIGKPTGNDMLEGRLTLPAIYALNTTDSDWAKQAALNVKNKTASPEEIAKLTEFAKQAGGIEHAQNIMIDYKEKALSLLSDFPESDVKTALTTYTNYVVERLK